MKRLYVIIACNKYYESRVIPSLNTWMKDLSDEEDYILMGEKTIPELKMVGFDGDNGQYDNVGWRKMQFISKYRDLLLDYDWTVFVDDDGYLFRDRHEKFLKQFHPDRSYIVGRNLGNSIKKIIEKHMVKYKIMHGGASISVSRGLMKDMVRKLEAKKEYYNNLMHYDIRKNGDIALSCLAYMSNGQSISKRELFHYKNHKIMRYTLEDYYRIISSHYATAADKIFLYNIEQNEKL